MIAAITALFLYGTIASMLGTLLPGLSSQFHLTPKQNGGIASVHLTAYEDRRRQAALRRFDLFQVTEDGARLLQETEELPLPVGSMSMYDYDLNRVRQMRGELFSRWDAVAPGDALELAFPPHI